MRAASKHPQSAPPSSIAFSLLWFLMPSPCFCEQTVDDLLHSVLSELLASGEPISPSKGHARELSGVLLVLKDPRARLSRTETRGRPFSCLGELCWYLAGTNDIQFIQYYVPDYSHYADGGVVYGAYGPRLFNWRGVNQFAAITTLLRMRPCSRKGVIQLFDASDLLDNHSDIPCTCTLQFMIRQGALHLFTNMRSNDAFLGLPHDVFAFTMLQEIMARALDVELGTYKHAVGSLHLYDKDGRSARQFLEEGLQSTVAMLPMPHGDPWPAIGALKEAESAIRTQAAFSYRGIGALHPYWADLVRLLQVYRSYKDKDAAAMEAIQAGMSARTFRVFIDRKLSELRTTASAGDLQPESDSPDNLT
jgi:thymidylate synthase